MKDTTTEIGTTTEMPEKVPKSTIILKTNFETKINGKSFCINRNGSTNLI